MDEKKKTILCALKRSNLILTGQLTYHTLEWRGRYLKFDLLAKDVKGTYYI